MKRASRVASASAWCATRTIRWRSGTNSARRALEDSLTADRASRVCTPRCSRSLRSGRVFLRHASHITRMARAMPRQVLRFAPHRRRRRPRRSARTREAVSHYQAALRYASQLTPEENARLQERLSYECYLTGQHQRAIESATLRAGNLARLGRRTAGGRYATVAVSAGLVCGPPRGSAAVRRRGR